MDDQETNDRSTKRVAFRKAEDSKKKEDHGYQGTYAKISDPIARIQIIL
jgi:hypothetical protein